MEDSNQANSAGDQLNNQASATPAPNPISETAPVTPVEAAPSSTQNQSTSVPVSEPVAGANTAQPAEALSSEPAASGATQTNPQPTQPAAPINQNASPNETGTTPPASAPMNNSPQKGGSKKIIIIFAAIVIFLVLAYFAYTYLTQSSEVPSI